MTVPIAEAPMTNGIRYARVASAEAYVGVISRAPAAGVVVELGIDEWARPAATTSSCCPPPQGCACAGVQSPCRYPISLGWRRRNALTQSPFEPRLRA